MCAKMLRNLELIKERCIQGFTIFKSKQSVPPSTPPAATPTKATTHPTVSPQGSGTQVACRLCKILFDDGSSVLGHISAEHPQYKFFCDYESYYRSFITRSGLCKHKKQVHPKEPKEGPETDDFTVGCILCRQEFNSEDACDKHDCPTRKKAKAVTIKKEPKVEPKDGNVSNGNKRSAHSSRGKK